MFILKFPKDVRDEVGLYNLDTARKAAKVLIEEYGVKQVDIHMEQRVFVETLTPRPFLKEEKTVVVQRQEEKEKG